MSAKPEKEKDNEKNILSISRQEILTGLMWAILAFIPASAVIVMVVVVQNPNLVETIEITGTVDLGKFIDKVVESYDAFLFMLGVTTGTAGTMGAIKTGKSLAEKK